MLEQNQYLWPGCCTMMDMKSVMDIAKRIMFVPGK